jgi:diguanylate cyclase (GGDEF)-like protein
MLITMLGVHDRPAVSPARSLSGFAEAAPRYPDAPAARARGAELASQLRAAALEGDDARVSRLLSDLLRLPGLSKGERISLQLKALLQVVHSLRAVVLTDDLTGLYNRRGFLQFGSRLLDVAVRDGVPAWLICFDIDQLQRVIDTAGRDTGDLLICQTGNLMRDLFPRYGVYEALGRLSDDQFAALTTHREHASRSAILRHSHRPQLRASDTPRLSLSIGVASFDPRRPLEIDELLQNARHDMLDNKPLIQSASTELVTPQPV